MKRNVKDTQTAVLVIGDACLDYHVHAEKEFINPDAPTFAVRYQNESCDWAPGMAANIAVNCAAMGAKTVLLAACGTDEEGLRLLHSLNAAGVDTQYMVRSSLLSTSLLMKIMSRQQQLFRLDRFCTYKGLVTEAFKNTVKNLHLDAVVMADYEPQVLTDADVAASIPWPVAGPLVIATSRKRAGCFKDADVLVVNREEWHGAAGGLVGKADVIITRGSDPIRLHERSSYPLQEFPVKKVKGPVSPMGAGDTFIAAYTIARAWACTNAQAITVAAALAAETVKQIGRCGAPVGAKKLRQLIANIRKEQC